MVAEKLPYWTTDTTLASNQERIEKELTRFGASATVFTLGRRGDSACWQIRFIFREKSFLFVYFPYRIEGDANDYVKSGRNRRTRGEQAIAQMSARAYHEIKAALTAAAFERDERDIPRSLFGYLELPGKSTSGVGKVVSDLNIPELVEILGLPALPAPEKSE